MDYIRILFDKYGTVLLNTIQVSEITSRSIVALELDRRKKRGIPYRRVGGAKNSPVRYTLHDVSDYLTATAEEEDELYKGILDEDQTN